MPTTHHRQHVTTYVVNIYLDSIDYIRSGIPPT